MLQGKKILVGITGSIAAYKSAYLVRILVQAGADVKVLMTKDALEFVTPLTFSTLSKNPVHSDFTEDKNSGQWTNHVSLALWADLMIIAPLTASTMSKMPIGQSDNFLMATYMSTRCPVLIAPAMDHDMYLHAGTQQNMLHLKSMGHFLIEPDEGELASGLYGKGRMAEPEKILDKVISIFNPTLTLKGIVALVTAGPTYEKIDPVRFIGNFSSGKMGISLAEQLVEKGAMVKLVCGPIAQYPSNPCIEVFRVTSAEEMHKKCIELFSTTDLAVCAAAVADYRPKKYSDQKMKKDQRDLNIVLEQNPDIAATLGGLKQKNQLVIGFALETENELENATKKLVAKKLDMIVVNTVMNETQVFGSDFNKITLIWADNKMLNFGLKSKPQVAADIVEQIEKLINP